MIHRLKLVDTLVTKEKNTKLHPEILTILFENRRYIKNIFLDIHGLYEISHIGMTIITPFYEMVSFSSSPNIEYNLIQQNLWKDDSCFSPWMPNKDNFSWWDDHKITGDFEKVEKIKLKNNMFSFGMTICKQVNDFSLLYSYATRATRDDLREYYASHLLGLVDIGDYFYKSLRDIYASYDIKCTPPELNHLNSKMYATTIRPHLTLIRSRSRAIKG